MKCRVHWIPAEDAVSWWAWKRVQEQEIKAKIWTMTILSFGIPLSPITLMILNCAFNLGKLRCKAAVHSFCRKAFSLEMILKNCRLVHFHNTTSVRKKTQNLYFKSIYWVVLTGIGNSSVSSTPETSLCMALNARSSVRLLINRKPCRKRKMNSVRVFRLGALVSSLVPLLQTWNGL